MKLYTNKEEVGELLKGLVELAAESKSMADNCSVVDKELYETAHVKAVGMFIATMEYFGAVEAIERAHLPVFDEKIINYRG